MRNRFSLSRIALVTAALAGLGLTAAVAAQPALANGTTLVSHASGKCMDVPGGSGNNRVQIQIWTCNANPWQGWEFLNAGNGFSLIENVFTGKCLSVLGNSTADGAAVIQYNCNFSGNDDFENWRAVNCSGSYCRYENEGDDVAGHVRYIRPHDCGTTDGTLLVMGSTCSNTADFWG
jgi:hypothetical protein